MLFDEVTIGFDEAETGSGQTIQILVVADAQSGIQVRVPLTPEGAKAIGAHLSGRPVVQVASKLP